MKWFSSYDSEYKSIRRFFILFFILNFIVWFFLTKNIKPDLTITPIPPGKHLLKAFSMGDDGLVYRYFGYKIQMAGDDYGTVTPLKNYNYAQLQKWFFLLDEFDPISEYIPSVAGLYYSNSQNPMDNIYIVDYLIKFSKKDTSKYWRWLTTAMYLANIKLHNTDKVNEISTILASADKNIVPLWARTIGIFMASKSDICASLNLIASLDEAEIKEIATDKIFSSKPDEGNIFLKLIINRIEEIKANPKAARECMYKKHLNK